MRKKQPFSTYTRYVTIIVVETKLQYYWSNCDEEIVQIPSEMQAPATMFT